MDHVAAVEAGEGVDVVGADVRVDVLHVMEAIPRTVHGPALKVAHHLVRRVGDGGLNWEGSRSADGQVQTWV